ncbi:MAG: TIGR01440 family protein [Clostridia bacterium]|nr:TIGR01440 family protein [Clostridia bacterium]
MSAVLYEEIREQAKKAAAELIEAAQPAEGSIMVIGCSSSEVIGACIGKDSSIETARAIFDGIYSVARERGIYIAAQCCEHLNRALVIEREAAVQRGLEQVNVVPQMKAGGSFATTAYERFTAPVVVESIRADLGMDIGDTFIGMHLKAVAVPVRLSINSIGEAHLTCARTRLKYIGGERAVYMD